MDFKREYLGQFMDPPTKRQAPGPGPIIKLVYEPEPFEVYRDVPENVGIEDPLLPEPRYERLLRDVGVQKIVDAVDIEVVGPQMSVSWNGDVLGQLISEQREVITAHLGHIIAKYFGQDSTTVREYVIKAKFHQDVQRLADLEEEPGEFE